MCCRAWKRLPLSLGLDQSLRPASVHFWALPQNEAPELSTWSLNNGSICSCSPWSRCTAADTAVACSPLPPPPAISTSVFGAAHSLPPTISSPTRRATSLSKQNKPIPQGNTTTPPRRIKGIVFLISWWGEGCALSLNIWMQPREHREISFALFCLTSNQTDLETLCRWSLANFFVSYVDMDSHIHAALLPLVNENWQSIQMHYSSCFISNEVKGAEKISYFLRGIVCKFQFWLLAKCSLATDQ